MNDKEEYKKDRIYYKLGLRDKKKIMHIKSVKRCEQDSGWFIADQADSDSKYFE